MFWKQLLVFTLSLGVCAAKEISIPPAQQPAHVLGLTPTPDTPTLLRALTSGITAPYFTDADFKKIGAAPDGPYIDYWENGRIKTKLTLKNHLPDGHFHAWYPDGKDAFKGHMENGTKQGIHIAFYHSRNNDGNSFRGRIFSYNLKGELDGEQKLFFPDGILQALVTYKNGHLRGLYTLYSSPGTCAFEHTY